MASVVATELQEQLVAR
jgi:hypothetical protein